MEPRLVVMQQLSFFGEALKREGRESTEWHFFSRDRSGHLVVGTQTLFVQYEKYGRYESLRGDFDAIVRVFFANCDQAQPNRLGLRYINEVKPRNGTPLEWSQCIDSSLLGTFTYKVPGAEPSRIFHNMEFVFAEPTFNLRFQFGVHNPDYPAPIRQKVFVLDFDAYLQGLFETAEIPAMLDVYHDAIQALFERSIAQGTREEMNE